MRVYIGQLYGIAPAHNQLTTLPALNGLTNITYLDFTGNLLTNIAGISGMRRIDTLYFPQNKLHSVTSLTYLPLLRYVDFSGNLLTNLSGLANLSLLDNLNLRDNKFTVAPSLAAAPLLHSVDFTTNLITDVSALADPTNLYYLYLDSNNLQDIHALTNLVYLNYLPIKYNLLNTNAGSAAMLDIAVLQTHAYVDYIPQRNPSTVLFLNPTRLSATQFRFTIQSEPGAAVRLYSSTDLDVWSLIGTLTNTTGSTNFTASAASSTSKYYKAR